MTPLTGRPITDADAPLFSPGARVALISHRLWTGTYASDPGVLGKSIQVNNVDVAIIGVLPRGFVGLEVDHGVDVFTTFDSVLAATAGRRQLAAVLFGRLRPGVTMEQALAQLRAGWPGLLDATLSASLPPTERANFRTRCRN